MTQAMPQDLQALSPQMPLSAILIIIIHLPLPAILQAAPRVVHILTAIIQLLREDVLQHQYTKLISIKQQMVAYLQQHIAQQKVDAIMQFAILRILTQVAPQVEVDATQRLNITFLITKKIMIRCAMVDG